LLRQDIYLGEATLLADSHAGNFLSPVIGNENGGSMPALILRKLLGKNESMRRGVTGSGKNTSRLVRIPPAIVDVKIEPPSFSQNPGLGFV
jgi:hypothetical protein